MRVTGIPVHIDTTWAISSSSTVGWSPATWACHSPRRVSTRSFALLSSSRRRVASSYSWALTAASLSRPSRSNSFWASRRGGGAEAYRRRTRLAASSMRSIALSGRWRSVM